MIVEMQSDLDGASPYRAVKTVHDALDREDTDRSVPSMGDPFVIAYLLEQAGVIETDSQTDYRSIVDRRPDAATLREWFWEERYTLWWIGVMTGVHPSLVTYWLYEDDIPLMERNYGEASMARIRAMRDE